MTLLHVTTQSNFTYPCSHIPFFSHATHLAIGPLLSNSGLETGDCVCVHVCVCVGGTQTI